VSIRKQVYEEYNFVTGEPTLIVIIPGEFVAEKLSSVSSPKADSWRPQI
jgi:hypothetical protein